MDAKNWGDFDCFNCIGNSCITLIAQEHVFNNVLTNIIYRKSNLHRSYRQLLDDTLKHLQL